MTVVQLFIAHVHRIYYCTTITQILQTVICETYTLIMKGLIHTCLY